MAALALFTASVCGGEPIKFSTTDQKKIEPARPGSNPLEKYLERPFESLRPDSSLGPVVPPQMLRPMPAPSLPEKSDREKAGWQNSWIFALPQNQARQPTAEEIFKVERVGPDGRPLQKPTLMEQYFKQRGGQPEEGRTGNTSREGASSPFGGRPNAQSRPDADPLNPYNRQEDALGTRREGNTTGMRSILDLDAGRMGSWSRNTVDRDALGGEASLSEFFRASHEEMKKERLRDEKRQEYRLMLESRTYHDLQQGRKEGGLGLQTPGLNEPPTIGPSVLREAGGLSRDLRTATPMNQDLTPLRRPSRSVLEEGRGNAAGGYLPSSPSALPETPRTSQQQRERPAVLPIPKRDF
ncbi:hypothetical protein NXS98_03235 [Fontisphaera persica]|uniref:hypothetical protein n=1 Tax=Fontisphaera persica TaxID=2974023 RepID=UPI0024C03144|nr:hypothetical protein [Fontisphaera persica]WCJ60154.1 hypothetical protein NXS98_03235 [Fontisphaera persica]